MCGGMLLLDHPLLGDIIGGVLCLSIIILITTYYKIIYFLTVFRYSYSWRLLTVESLVAVSL